MVTTQAPAPPKPGAIVEIERLGFAWTEVAQYDLSRLDINRRVQVRESAHYAPKDQVERYAIQMAEAQFPPVIVTADNWIVDGNTRVGACDKRKVKFFPAVVLDVGWENASATQRNELLALAATLNAVNGQPLTAKETREVAARFIELGWKTEQIGRAIGLRPGGVTQVRKEIDAAKKLQRVGMDANGSLKGASLRALGGKEVLSLNDVPFKELAALAGDAGMNAGEITATAKDARESGSDAAAIKLIGDMRTEFVDRIKQRELTGKGHPPASRQLRQHLGFVTKFAGIEHELVENNPDDSVRQAHRATIQKAIDVLNAVLQAQP
jgi:hypothetical protein